MKTYNFDYDSYSACGEGEYRAKTWEDAKLGIADYVAWHIDTDDAAEVTIWGSDKNYPYGMLVTKLEDNKNGLAGKHSIRYIF